MSASDGKDWKSVLLPYAEAWGSHAVSPYPAWILSGLSSVPTPSPTAPVGLGSAASTLATAATSSTSPSAAATQGRNHAGSSIIAAARAPLAALPPFYQLVGFSAVFGGGGYIVSQGDSLNGSGVMSAWSMLFLFFRLIPSLRPRAPAQPLPFILSSSTLVIGSVYAAHYFSRTSWRGVAPFTPPPAPRVAARNSKKGSDTPTLLSSEAGDALSSTARRQQGIASSLSTSASSRTTLGDASSIGNLWPWIRTPSQYMNLELTRSLSRSIQSNWQES
ncbi:hypothetical protein A4X09_0g2847 [Tilletia walkeri]|uniref:Uncharacterized protein n=1 Tax=Tilletia walkeri TaxID=117179 RepID=A0A8X7NC22_9BASI|nr:hypothetical protein A4X09_0g2847 [Tilletia walkeri]